MVCGETSKPLILLSEPPGPQWQGSPICNLDVARVSSFPEWTPRDISLSLTVLRYPPFLCVTRGSKGGAFATNFNCKVDTMAKMNLLEPENSCVTYNHCNNTGNTTNSHNKTEFHRYNISVSDERPQVLEWLSPSASRERHQTVRETRVDGVGDWLLHDRRFSTWRTSEDQAVNPVLLCYGDPGVGKTYIRYEPPRPTK